MKKIILVSAVLFAGPAFGHDNFSFYGATGNYVGNAQGDGGNIMYTGKYGEYLGSSSTMGNDTSFYGSSGQYLGEVKNNSTDW